MIITKSIFEKIFNYTKIFTIFSAFTGILYQYISIKGNISFFSYSQVINDSVVAIPLVMIYILSIWTSYYYIFFYIKKFKAIKFNNKISIIFGITINLLIAFYIYNYVIFKVNYVMNNNLYALFVFYIFYLSIFNIISHVFINMYKKKTIKIIYTIFGIVLYFTSISIINEVFYKNICIFYENKYVHVNYLNDKYIFIDNGNIIKIDKVDGFLRKKECEK